MTLQDRYNVIQSKITRAAEKAGRPVEAITLVGVTKTHPPEVVEEGLRLGILQIGENKVQEALAKKLVVGERGIWRLIGHLQSNKVKKAVQIFDCIDSIDSELLAMEVSRHCEAMGKRLKVLMEVNVSGEGSKFGVKPEKALELAEKINSCQNLELTGLMTLAPAVQELEKVRPYFKCLRELRDEIQSKSGIQLPDLSMGMSHDYEIAIEEGSTMVRIGSALFGSRPKPTKSEYDESI